MGACITLIYGEIISYALAHGGILVHQTNCKRVAGAGLAAAISRTWPAWAETFRRTTPHMGNCWIQPVAPNNLVAVWVASLYAQNGYGTGRRHTDYEAFDNALMSLYIQTIGLRNLGHEVIFPVGIGCGLAGGDWKIVYPMIEEHFPDAILIKYGGGSRRQ